jgi:signal transduction histidine kinase
VGAVNEIERALGPQAEELQSLLGMLRRGVQRVLRTADRLDRAAQLEAGSPTWRKASIDLRSLVTQVARETALLEARNGVQVETKESETPCFVEADATWVRAAVAELVANAVRFARSRVSVETRFLDREAWVIIVDDGPGFDGHAQSRFEPPLTGRGLGLSLPLVRDVVEAYAGRIEFRDATSADSALEGTRATVVFPLAGRGPSGEVTP